MLKRHLKMVMGMLCCLLAVLALTGALQPGHAEILDYDEYMAGKPVDSDGLCRAGGAVSASAETIPYIFCGRQL